MDLFDVIVRRQSIRRFASQPIADAMIRQIVESANRAPSAGNLQAYQIYVVKEASVRRRLDAASGSQGPMAQAPVVLVFCAVPSRSASKYGSRGAQLFCVQDATIACAYAQLVATALGLASVWIGAVFEPELIEEALRLESDIWPIALLPIGYPAESPDRKPRRSLQDLVREI